MNLEDIMLSELSQLQKKNTVTTVQFHSYELLRVVRTVQTESRIVVPGL